MGGGFVWRLEALESGVDGLDFEGDLFDFDVFLEDFGIVFDDVGLFCCRGLCFGGVWGGCQQKYA